MFIMPIIPEKNGLIFNKTIIDQAHLTKIDTFRSSMIIIVGIKYFSICRQLLKQWSRYPPDQWIIQPQ